MAVLQVGKRSNTVGSLIIIDCLAAIEIALIIVIGIAIRRGQGVAMTNTAKKRIASPDKYQAPNAISNAKGAKIAPIWSPKRRNAGRFCSASCNTATIDA